MCSVKSSSRLLSLFLPYVAPSETLPGVHGAAAIQQVVIVEIDLPLV